MVQGSQPWLSSKSWSRRTAANAAATSGCRGSPTNHRRPYVQTSNASRRTGIGRDRRGAVGGRSGAGAEPPNEQDAHRRIGLLTRREVWRCIAACPAPLRSAPCRCVPTFHLAAEGSSIFRALVAQNARTVWETVSLTDCHGAPQSGQKSGSTADPNTSRSYLQLPPRHPIPAPSRQRLPMGHVRVGPRTHLPARPLCETSPPSVGRPTRGD
jgi:hypothetical protein